MELTFKKPSVAASVAVLASVDKKILMIKRRSTPFKGKYAFPGGFLDVDKEDIYQTAVRELEEETGIKVTEGELVLIDIRSKPTRDPRSHVVDVGFLCIRKNTQDIPKKTEEAIPLWLSLDKIDELDFAFDHDEFWRAIRTYIENQNIDI